MSEKQIKYTIFLVLLTIFPAGFYLVFDFAIWPVFYPLIQMSGLFLLFSIPILTLVNCAFWAVLYYFLASFLTNKIVNGDGTINRLLVKVLIAIAVVICLVPIFDTEPTWNEKTTVFGVYLELF